MSVEFKDYYRILGVDRKADEKTIKSAYRKLARKHHPDVAKTKDAGARFKEISEAYWMSRSPPLSPALRRAGLPWLILLVLLVLPVPMPIGEAVASGGRGC